MDSSNLAIVLTPAFFPMDEKDMAATASATGKKAASGTDKLVLQTQIVDNIIQLSSKVT